MVSNAKRYPMMAEYQVIIVKEAQDLSRTIEKLADYAKQPQPSTILVFSIAFGLSVDDTIHFLAQYRQELTHNKWKIKKSVFATLKEAGVSMFYTSVVLFAGFSVFLLSDFGGTVALGGLIAITLFFGMLSNLMLLPCLVLTLNKRLTRQQELKESEALEALKESELVEG